METGNECNLDSDLESPNDVAEEGTRAERIRFHDHETTYCKHPIYLRAYNSSLSIFSFSLLQVLSIMMLLLFKGRVCVYCVNLVAAARKGWEF